MDSVFIDDGISREGYVPAVPGLHGSLKFTFRPALAEARFIFLKAPDDGGKAYTERVCALVERHLQEWDAKRGDQPVPVKAENIRRLQPNVLVKILDQVLGYAPAEQEADEKN